MITDTEGHREKILKDRQTCVDRAQVQKNQLTQLEATLVSKIQEQSE
jgi:hypothetical protein